MIQSRPPIVVILGHVDHGKTSLLDYIRKSNVAAREAGGITQHIRSFQITANDKLVTFIDTPGHAAFANMRARGSKIADIAILVISAVDGVMPQTKQSIAFIKSAKIPFIVALNKSDLPDADPMRIKTQLTESEIIVEDFGGDVPCLSVSAKTGAGVPELLEMIQLLAELDSPQSDPEAPAEAVVLESRLNTKTGPTAVVVVKNGTLNIGQNLFQAEAAGKVRSLIDSNGKTVTTASPSTPVEVLGLSVVPEVGSVLSDQAINSSPVKKSPSYNTPEAIDPDAVKLVLKTDVAGSLEAILGALPAEFIVMHAATGEVTENDVILAKDTNAIVVAFNTKVTNSSAKLAEVEKVRIQEFKIIYELLDSVDKLKHPVITEIVLGRAEILKEFDYDGTKIAGCRCTEGVISRSDQVKIMRGDKQVGLVKLKTLQSGKLQVEKIKSGTEFGASFSPSIDFKLQDSIIALKYESH